MIFFPFILEMYFSYNWSHNIYTACVWGKGSTRMFFLLCYIRIIMKHTVTNQHPREARAPSPESQKASILMILRMVTSTKMIHPPLLMRATSFKWMRSCVNLFVIIAPSASHLWKCVMENQIVLMAKMTKAATLTVSFQVSRTAAGYCVWGLSWSCTCGRDTNTSPFTCWEAVTYFYRNMYIL